MTPANGLDRALRLDASVTADALAADGTGVLTRLQSVSAIEGPPDGKRATDD